MIGTEIGSGICFGIEIGSIIGSGLAPESESESIAKLSRFLNLHKNRRLGSMMLRIDSRKESTFICKRSIPMEISGLISQLKILIIKEPILISELVRFLESILIPLPE